MAITYKPRKTAFPATIEAAYKADPRVALAQALQKEAIAGGPAATPWVGLSRVLNAGIGTYAGNKAQDEYGKRGDAYNDTMKRALAAGLNKDGGGTQQLLQILGENPDTQDLSLQAALAMALEGAKKDKDKGSLVTPEQAVAIGLPKGFYNVTASGEYKPVDPPKQYEYAPNTTIVDPLDPKNRTVIPNAPPTGFERGPNGLSVDPQYRQFEYDKAAIPTGGQIVQAGIDAGGKSGQALVDRGLNIVGGGGVNAPISTQPDAFPTKGPQTPQEAQMQATAEQAMGGPIPPASPVTSNKPTMDRTGLPANGIDVTHMASKADRTQMAEKNAKMYENIQKGGIEAPSNLQLIKNARTNLKDAITGPFASARLVGRKIENFITDRSGNKIRATENLQRFLGTSALELRNPSGGAGMPGSMSDKDLSFLREIAGKIDNQTATLGDVLDAREKLEQRKIEVAQLADQYIKEHGALDSGFSEQLSQYSLDHPMFNTSPTNTTPANDGWEYIGPKK